MKRLLVSLFALNLLFVGVQLCKHAWAGIVATEDRFATTNGDTNGDGFVDISDAKFLLEHLFLGGPTPVALAGSPDLADRVAALEARLAAVEELTPSADEKNVLKHFDFIPSREEVLLKSANFRIVNDSTPGAGNNGLGVLFLGHERGEFESHHLIVQGGVTVSYFEFSAGLLAAASCVNGLHIGFV